MIWSVGLIRDRIDRIVIERRIVFFDEQFIAWPETGAFAVSVLADGQQSSRGVGDDHSDDFVLFLQRDSFDTRGVSAHGTRVVLAESDSHPTCGRKDDLVFGFGDHDIDQFVVFSQFDRDDAPFFRSAVSLQRGLFDDAFFGGHH